MVHGYPVRLTNPIVGDFTNFIPRMNDVRSLKQNLTLDLHKDASRSKKNKFETALLSTPELQPFALNSSEVEKMLCGSSIDFQTPTPTTVRTILFSKPEPDMYDDDNIANVLNNLSNESSHTNIMNGLPKSNSTNSSNTSNNLTMNDYDYENQYPAPLTSSYSMEVSPLPVKIKDEPQTVPNMVSPPVSPVNMDSQERLKADRKKARNRLAAAKCRKKKLERIASLENRVKELKDENNELGQKQASLKKEVISLKERIVRHYQNGCSITSIMPHSVPMY